MNGSKDGMTDADRALRAAIAAEIVAKFGGLGPYAMVAEFVKLGPEAFTARIAKGSGRARRRGRGA